MEEAQFALEEATDAIRQIGVAVETLTSVAAQIAHMMTQVSLLSSSHKVIIFDVLTLCAWGDGNENPRRTTRDANQGT